MQKILSYKSSEIAYHVFGNGLEVVFCFHGYGLDGSCFDILEETLHETHTLFCIDFPFHGNTKWNEGLEFTQNDLTAIISLLRPFPTNKYVILGYSMGGKIALHLLQSNPDSIKKVILIAPDGLRVHFWQYLSTQTRWGNKLFEWTMQNPHWLFILVRIGETLRILNRSIAKFVHHHIDSESERKVLYYRWTSMRAFTTNLSLIKHLITTHKIPVNIITGAFDRVITTSQGERFKKGEPLITLTELHSGHHLLKEHWVEDIAKMFLENNKE